MSINDIKNNRLHGMEKYLNQCLSKPLFCYKSTEIDDISDLYRNVYYIDDEFIFWYNWNEKIVGYALYLHEDDVDYYKIFSKYLDVKSVNATNVFIRHLGAIRHFIPHRIVEL